MQEKGIISMKHIHKSYKMGDNEVVVLKDVSLDVAAGEFVALLGPSGSGKSTLMNIMGCIDRADSGEYFLNEENVAELNENKLAVIRNQKIGFIFQQFNLLPRYTAVQNVEMPLLLRGMPRKETTRVALEMLEKVGLQDRAHHKPSELSGGQQQRVAIARALTGKPGILLADEPTGNLDSKSGEEIMEMVVELNQQGHTIILITHDLGIARKARRVVHIKDGGIYREEIL